MNGKTGRRRVLGALTLALLACAVAPAGVAHGQEEYDIPMPPAPPPPPPPPPPPAADSGAPRLMRPFPRVRTAGTFTRESTRLTRVTVRAPEGATITTRCRRARCTSRRTMGERSPLRLRRLERAFAPRTVIEIRIGAAAAIGKYVEIRIRAGRPPLRRDRCLPPGRTEPRPCSSA